MNFFFFFVSDATNSVVLKYVSGQCIGGCDIDGPPLTLNESPGEGSEKSRFYSSKKSFHEYKANFETLEQFPFDQVRNFVSTSLQCAPMTTLTTGGTAGRARYRQTFQGILGGR